MFRWVVSVAIVGFLVAWFLEEVPLRDSMRGEAADIGGGFSMPESPDRVVLLEQSLAGLMHRMRTDEAPDPLILASSGTSLPRDQAWAIGQVQMLRRARGEATVAAIARAHWVLPEVLEPVYEKALALGTIEFDGTRLHLTDRGHEESDRIKAAWRTWLCSRIDDWDCANPGDRALLDQALDNIATKLLDESDRPEMLTAARV